MSGALDVDHTGRIYPEGRDYEFSRTNVLRGSHIEDAIKGTAIETALAGELKDEDRARLENELLGTLAYVDTAVRTGDNREAWIRWYNFRPNDEQPDKFADAQCKVSFGAKRPSQLDRVDWVEVEAPFTFERGVDTIVNVSDVLMHVDKAEGTSKKHKVAKGLATVIGVGAAVGVLGFEIARRRRNHLRGNK